MAEQIAPDFDDRIGAPDRYLSSATDMESSSAPERSRRVALPLTAAALSAVGAGWYWLSPVLALEAFRGAVSSGDAADIAEMVDFPALREQLRTEMVSRAMMGSGKTGEKLADLAFVDVSLGALASPAGMQQFIQGAELFAFETQGQGQSNNWDIERRGLSSFKAQRKTGASVGPQFVFRRDGLGWRLAAIYAPQPRSGGPDSEPAGVSTNALAPATIDAINAAERRAEAEAQARTAIAAVEAASADPWASGPEANGEMVDAASDAARAAAEAARAAQLDSQGAEYP